MKVEFLKDYRGKLTKERPYAKGQIVDCRVDAYVLGDVLVERGIACVYGAKPKVEEVIVEEVIIKEVKEEVIVIEEPKVVKKKVAKKAPKKVSK